MTLLSIFKSIINFDLSKLKKPLLILLILIGAGIAYVVVDYAYAEHVRETKCKYYEDNRMSESISNYCSGYE
jgi:hypothetical protein